MELLIESEKLILLLFNECRLTDSDKDRKRELHAHARLTEDEMRTIRSLYVEAV